MTAQAGGFELYQPDRELSREELIDALAGVPGQMRAVVGSHADGALERLGDDDEWSPIEVCRHLRDAVQVYGMRFKWMILDNKPFLPNYDENRWAAESPDGADDVESMLQEIAAYRGETVRLLRALPENGWERRGRHEVNGWVALEPYVRHELAHEEQHLEQLRLALGTSP